MCNLTNILFANQGLLVIFLHSFSLNFDFQLTEQFELSKTLSSKTQTLKLIAIV